VPPRAVLRIVTGRRPQSGPITRASGVRAPAPGRTSLRARHRRSRSQSVRRHGAALPASFRVAAIRLDSVARLHWDHRRRHYDAAMSTIGQPTVQPVTTRDGFVAEAQTTALPSLAAILRRILGRTQKPGPAAPHRRVRSRRLPRTPLPCAPTIRRGWISCI
jgi:hypothetical protein